MGEHVRVAGDDGSAIQRIRRAAVTPLVPNLVGAAAPRNLCAAAGPLRRGEDEIVVARRRPDRRRPGDRRLVTPLSLRSRLRTPRRRRPDPRLLRPTTWHRLSRGCDRQLNRALHTAILHRRHHDPATKAYIARRTAEGKSRRDATRQLKRHLPRHLYRVLEQSVPQTTWQVIGASFPNWRKRATLRFPLGRLAA